MKLKEVKALNNGIYTIYWQERHGCGSSLAAVGRLANGLPWMAPTNWSNLPDAASLPALWRQVAKVVPLMPG